MTKRRTSLDKVIRAIWARELEILPLDMAAERKYHERTAAMIRDEELRSLFVPKWLISKSRKELKEDKQGRKKL